MTHVHPILNAAVQGALLLLIATALLLELRCVWRDWCRARKVARENEDGC